MNKDFVEALSIKLGNHLEQDIRRFFSKTTKEQFETLKYELSRILEPQNPLRLLFEKMATELIEEVESLSDKDERWNSIQENLWSNFDYHFQLTFQHYFRYSLLFCLLSDSRSSVFSKQYLSDSKKIFGLQTSGELKNALLKTLDRCFFDEVKRGGKKKVLNNDEKLRFLAFYNRYLVVIKNARNEYRQLIRKVKTNRFSKIQMDLIKKYEIPEDYLKSLFSFVNTPSETAIIWAKKILNIKLKNETLKDILKETRKQWNAEGQIIVDCKIKPGKVYRMIDKNDSKKMKALIFPSKINVPIHAYFSSNFLRVLD